MSFRLVLVRHCETEWNVQKRFSGWANPALTADGQNHAIQIGKLLQERKLQPDMIVSSALSRSIHTAQLIIDAMCKSGKPVDPVAVSDYRMNEQHYGNLTGMTRTSAETQFGEQQVRKMDSRN